MRVLDNYSVMRVWGVQIFVGYLPANNETIYLFFLLENLLSQVPSLCFDSRLCERMPATATTGGGVIM